MSEDCLLTLASWQFNWKQNSRR